MAKDKHNGKDSRKRGKIGGKRASALLLAFILIAAAAVGGVLTWKKYESGTVTNKFEKGAITAQVQEKFENNVKSEVNVKNAGSVPAYIRIQLVAYRVNDAGAPIGGAATFTMPTSRGENWVEHTDGYYYYTKPVAPGENTSDLLNGGSITLREYADDTGGKQRIEVLAEAIQVVPAQAVGEAWGVTIEENSVVAYSANP